MTAAMLKWAKTKSAFKDQKNVKDAKVFKDLTPFKQKIIKSQYEKRSVRTVARLVGNDNRPELYLLGGDGIYKPGTYTLKKVFKDQGLKALNKKTISRPEYEVEAGDGRAYALFTPTQAKEYRKLMKENKTFFEGLTFKKETSGNFAFWKREGILK